MRTFISLNPDIDTKRKISEIQIRLKEKISTVNKSFLDLVKWESEINFHMTLFFIGEVNEDDLSKIRSVLNIIGKELQISEMGFTFKGIDAFPKLKFPRVLILDLTNKDGKVFELSDTINSALKEHGYISDKKFHPHITLGRVKRDRKINLTCIRDTLSSDLSFKVNSFCLMKSELKSSGAEYSVMEEYEL
ncbi:MAG: RNA 2',3'-cyclic phosphodiesterase [Bacteroidetes bacterium]|nr:RNA 2',3'-cyclic phosphodiesterase [Bacteroidota bacterium]